jgi:hypothetical protein
MKLQDLIDLLKGKRQPLISPIANPVQAKQPDKRAEIERKIRGGLKAYSLKYAGGQKLPIEDYVPMFVEATKYPIFQKYPFLLPQISIQESSGGRNVTRTNNPLNWGARIQQQGQYSPSSWDESIQDMISAVSGDRPKGTSRYRQTLYYEPFRRSQDLRDFANTYESANPNYYNDLMQGMKVFETQ